MKSSETNTPGDSLATSEFRLLRHHQIALEGVLRLQREVEQKADSAAGHDVPEHFCSPRAEPVRHRTQRQNAADGEEHARAVKLRAARPKRVFYPEAKRLFSGRKQPVFRNRSSRRRKAASSRRPFSRPRRRGRRAGRGRCCRTAFPGWSRSGTALPAGRKPLLLAALFRTCDGGGDEPGEVAGGRLFPAGAAQELLFPPEESRFFSLPFFAPVTARATSRARSPSGCFSRLGPRLPEARGLFLNSQFS